jgi:hypothetical protein
LIEVKSKATIDRSRVFRNEARHLYDMEVLRNIGTDETFKVTRVIAYMGETTVVNSETGNLLLVNIEDLLDHYDEFEDYFDRLTER